jgi:hypothetical protein
MFLNKAIRLGLAALGRPTRRNVARRLGRRLLRYETLENRRLLAAIHVGDWLIPAGETAWTIPISATGGDRVDGINFNIQIEDGQNPSADPGPVLKSLDILNGTIFDGKNTGSWDNNALDGIAWDWTETNPNEIVHADGIIGHVTVNTVDCPNGTWDLIMSDTLNGPTDFAGMPAAIVDGTITVSQRPVADAGGPYSVNEAGWVTLDGSNSSDPDASDTIFAYEWDLDGDAVYAETGTDAERGDEVGVTPTFVGTGLGGFSSWLVRLRVQDNNGLLSAPVSAAVTLSDMNEAPVLVEPIADQTAGANGKFRFALDPDTFVDPDPGQTLSYVATQADGSPLPGWLAFDAQTRTFSGRPLVRDDGQCDIRVTATDSGSPGLVAWDDFSITVTTHEFPWQNADLPPDVDGSEAATPLDVLTLINWINDNGAGPVPTPLPDPTDSPLFLDVYGDNLVTAIDVLTTVNHLNAQDSGSGEGENVLLPSFSSATESSSRLSTLGAGYEPARNDSPSSTLQPKNDQVSADDERLTPYCAVDRRTDQGTLVSIGGTRAAVATSDMPGHLQVALAEIDALLPDIAHDVASAWSHQ